MRNKLLTAFLLGLITALLFAYTNNWVESTPTDATVANQIDDFNRKVRVDVAERLETYIAGFNSSDSNAGFYHVLFIENAAALSTPAANKGLLYGLLASSKCELAYTDEDGDEVQITSGGYLNSAALLAAGIPAGSYAPNSVDSADYAQGSIDAVHLAADVIDETKIADDGIDSEHYNDASIDSAHINNVFGAYTANDDDPTAMVVAHAYLANQDGFVMAVGTVGPSGGASTLTGYVDTDTNPASGGTIMAKLAHTAYAADNDVHTITFPVASGKYFEITVSNFDSITIIWQPIGTLVAPSDQD